MNRQLDSHRFTLEDTIRAVLNSSDIVDIALIKKISDDKKFVDVEHIIKPELYLKNLLNIIDENKNILKKFGCLK